MSCYVLHLETLVPKLHEPSNNEQMFNIQEILLSYLLNEVNKLQQKL